MDRLRIGVIGLGWFGEIHCETIIGIPNLELAALCTRNARPPGRAGREIRRRRRPIATIATCWPIPRSTPCRSSPCGTSTPSPPSPPSKPASMCSSKSRWPRPWPIAARSSPPRRRSKGILQVGHICRFNPRYRMAKQAIDAGRIGRIVAMSSQAQHPRRLDAGNPQQDRADRRRCHPRHRSHAVVHRRQHRQRLCPDRGCARAQIPDIGQTMYRFAGGATATLETVWCMPEKTPFDIDERMSIIGTEGIIHVQDTFPNLGICRSDKLHSPDTTYWPMFDGVRGGALREEFSYFADCALKGRRPRSAGRRMRRRLSRRRWRPRNRRAPAMSSGSEETEIMAKKTCLGGGPRQYGHEPCARLYAHSGLRGGGRVRAAHRQA